MYYVFIILDDTFEKDTSYGMTHLKKALVMDCIFFTADIPVCKVTCRTMWHLSVLIPFTGDFIFSSLETLSFPFVPFKYFHFAAKVYLNYASMFFANA